LSFEDGESFCSYCGAELLAAPSADGLPGSSPGGGIVADLPEVEIPVPPLPSVDASPLPPLDLPQLSPLNAPLQTPLVSPPLPPLHASPLPGEDVPPLPGVCELRRGAHGGNPFSVEVDTMLPLQAEIGISFRLLFSPSPGTGKFSDVTMSISPVNGNFPIKEKKRQSVAAPYEFVFGGSGLEPGVWVCDVSVSYILDNRRHSYDGTIELFVHGRENWLREAESCIAFLASDQGVRKLSETSSYFRVEVPKIARKLLSNTIDEVKRNPLEKVVELVSRGVRKYQKVAMAPSDGVEMLQKPPAEAVCREIQLDFGHGFGRVQFFTDPILGVGRTHDGVRYTDIIVDPPACADEMQRSQYGKMSRGHCLLQSNGTEVEIVDGRIRSSGFMAESTNGTYLDGEKIGICGRRTLRDGTIGLGTTTRQTALEARIVTPKEESCQRCRLGGESREYCCRAGRACANVVLRRGDGVPVVYVALWSCIDMGVIHKAFSGLEIFYDNHAFAWRKGTRRGWIIPGGKINLSHFRPIAVSKVWDEAGKPHLNSQGITKKGDTE